MDGSTISTIGYTEPSAQERIDAFLAQDRARHILLDIRYRPYSRWRPAFNHQALYERYGVQYAHEQALGNVNYQGGPIALLDAAKGVELVLNLLRNGNTVMLLCACKDYERCHRKVVYELIIAALAEAR
ncbi:MAG: DUF488 family protein, N3 subclade [Ktedonobacteraceae bacterium]